MPDMNPKKGKRPLVCNVIWKPKLGLPSRAGTLGPEYCDCVRDLIAHCEEQELAEPPDLPHVQGEQNFYVPYAWLDFACPHLETSLVMSVYHPSVCERFVKRIGT